MPAKRTYGMDQDFYPWSPIVTRPVLRWPDHALVQTLCREVGPLAATSANLHGAPPVTTASEVVGAFGAVDQLAAVLDGGVCDGVPSAVVVCRGATARCLRQGAIPWAVLAADGEDGGPGAGVRWETGPGRG